jgi:acetyltransferase-like isoleucine patch superfamily enzyme
LFGPVFLFGFVLMVKKTLDLMFGKLRPSSASARSQLDKWRMSLMKSIYPGSALHDLTALFGQHYEMTSIVLRLLGANVGKRVYWPGTGPSIGDYHLLDIGDDVVFGSRAHLVTSDGTGAETITVRDGAMIADRVTCLPGVTVGENTVLGSGALTRRNKTYPANGVYVGSRGRDAICLTAGSSENSDSKTVSPSPSTSWSFEKSFQLKSKASEATLTMNSHSRTQSDMDTSTPPYNSRVYQDGSLASGTLTLRSDIEKDLGFRIHGVTPQELQRELESLPRKKTKTAALSPFGRAFYLGEAPYYVLGQFTIFVYSVLIMAFVSLYWNSAFIVSAQLIFRLYHHAKFLNGGTKINPFVLFGLFSCFMSLLITVQSFIALLIVIAAKWILLGRRTPGDHSWDREPYCQRWQIFLAIERIRRQCFRGSGVLGMLTGTHWCVLYFRALGATIGRDCALFANGRPSLTFTEPDLLSLGDRVTVDDASLVGHINTRGKFSLNWLRVGDRCVLRTGSRLLSGAEMQNDSCLLEHTLVMGGEVVPEATTMQGWPAEVHTGERVKIFAEKKTDSV